MLWSPALSPPPPRAHPAALLVARLPHRVGDVGGIHVVGLAHLFARSVLLCVDGGRALTCVRRRRLLLRARAEAEACGGAGGKDQGWPEDETAEVVVHLEGHGSRGSTARKLRG